MKPELKIISVSFFYKSYSIQLNGDVRFFLNDMEFYYHSFYYEHIKSYKLYIEQLEEFRLEKDLSDFDKSIFAMNVYILTKMGKLKQDEYNGTLYCYENK